MGLPPESPTSVARPSRDQENATAGGTRWKLRWLTALLVVAALAATHAWWLRALSHWLVHNDAPFRADMVLVLAGDGTGYRILKAADLVAKGYAPKVGVSGPQVYYDLYESDIAIPFAVRHGYPAGWFIPLPNVSFSTDEEARAIVPELRKLQVKRLIVVTSDYHTGRSWRVYRRLAPDMELRMVAAPVPWFTMDDWWRSRQGRKHIFYEYTKSLAYLLGM